MIYVIILYVLLISFNTWGRKKSSDEKWDHKKKKFSEALVWGIDLNRSNVEQERR